MKTITDALVATRGCRYLRLIESRHTTTAVMVDSPEEATWVTPSAVEELYRPRDAAYYFENSPRARGWVEGCTMVGFRFTVTIDAGLLP